MSYEQLRKKLAALNAEIDTKRAEAKRLAAELDTLAVEKAAEDKVARMSDAEKRALAQVLGAQGIPSGEKVGKPGI